VVQGDAFVYNSDGSSEFARLIAGTAEGSSSLMSSPVAPEDVSRYGIIDFDEDTGGFRGIVDYPEPGQAPSNQMNQGNYVLNYDILTKIHEYCQLNVSGEYQITSVISQYVLEKGAVSVIPSQGEYLDCGNVHGWLHANQLIVNRT